ncbi:sulfuric ester hydrolase [Aureococcus anophagefferens]|uniref:Sulfuric ester hydrolase n=2 Tax=Aureococcus anophagefferens TaxID=44056 RepID=A0ABR1FK29_AURAN
MALWRVALAWAVGAGARRLQEEDLRKHFEQHVWRWNAGGGRAWDDRFPSDGAMRDEWSRLAGEPYPGLDRGGSDLRCRERGPLRTGQVRKKYVEEVVRALVRERDLPLARSLEIGPCNNPIDLPTSLVRVADTLDSEAGAAYCAARAVAARGGDANMYRPTYVDDGQFLAKVPSGYYDLLYTSHVMEHMPNPMLALRHWLRVLRPGGLCVTMLPDPCERGLMDRARLALPAAHFVAEFESGETTQHSVLDDHGLEIALSATRYAELAINNGRRADALAELRGAEAYLASTTSNGFQASVNVRLKAEHMVKMARFVANAIPDFPPLNVSHVSPKRLRDTVDSLRQGNQELGHVHVWSHATLVDYLLAAEKAVPDDAHFVALAAEVCGMPYGPAQPLDDAPHTEYRIVLQRAIPRREGPRSEPDGSRGPHVDLGKRWIVMAALSRRYQAGHARAWPVLLPARDHAGGSPGSRFPPADLADLFPKKRADGRPARWADPPPRGRQRGPLAGIPNPILPGGGLHPAYAKLDISPVEMEVLEHAAKIAATLGDDDDDDDMMAPPPGADAP